MWWFTIIHASQECACRLRVLSGNSASMLDSFVFRRCLCHGYNTCCSQEMGRHAEILMLATNLSVHGAMHVAHVMKRVRKPAGLHDCGKVALSNAWKCNLHHNGSTPIFNWILDIKTRLECWHSADIIWTRRCRQVQLAPSSTKGKQEMGQDLHFKTVRGVAINIHSR